MTKKTKSRKKKQGMTEVQLQRWLQLSVGLAQHSYPRITEARKAKLVTAVKDCIDWIVCNGLDTVSDWDEGIYEDGRLQYECAGTRMSSYMWDKGHEFEHEYKGEYELRTTRFGTMLACCVRAGFDLAVAPSTGVLGYSVGNLRAIFDGQLPKWVQDFFGENKDALMTAGDGEPVWL